MRGGIVAVLAAAVGSPLLPARRRPRTGPVEREPSLHWPSKLAKAQGAAAQHASRCRPADLLVGAEPGAVPHGPVPLPLLPGQPAGRRAAQSQAPAGLRLAPDQAGHGPPGHLLRLVLPRAGKAAAPASHRTARPSSRNRLANVALLHLDSLITKRELRCFGKHDLRISL